ncbi:MAG: patatin-like phospholipase family protein [Bacteroidales bacterium]
MLDRGYQITSIAGTSIGSLIGGVYISGKLPLFKKWMIAKGKLDIIKLMDFAVSNNGFIKGEKVFGQLKRYLMDADIRDLNIPYAAIAVDIQNMQEVVFRSGRLQDAIRASVSIPTVLRPVIHNGLELIDGGVLNPLPLSAINRTPGDILVAIDLNADIEYKPINKVVKVKKEHSKTYDHAIAFINEKWSAYFHNEKPKRTGFFDLITLSLYAMQIKLTQIAIDKYKPDVLVKVSRDACAMFEFHRAEEMIEYGRIQMRKALDGVK